MSTVLVSGAVLQCSHGGQLTLSQGNKKLSVGGSQVIIAGMESSLSFALGAPGVTTPCPKMASAGSPPPPSPCSSTQAASSGVASKLTVDGKGVLLATASGQAVNLNDPNASWQVNSAGQSLLKAS
jgi:hypothetical protein